MTGIAGMKVRFWGVRGSVPTPLRRAELQQKLVDVLVAGNDQDLSTAGRARAFLERVPVDTRTAVGGNTPCVEVLDGNQRLILDAGSGIRDLGTRLMQEDFGQGAGEAHVLLSHTHWDHIQGIPFFAPVYVPGNRITFWGAHPRLRERLRRQHHPTNFPVPFEALPAQIGFGRLTPGRPRSVAGFTVTPRLLCHPGDAYAFRIEHAGTVFVYASDGSYSDLTPEELASYQEFYRDADLLVFDAHFALVDSIEKSDWGHSSSFIGVDIALKANVKQLLLFHHDPYSDEAQLQSLCESTHHYLEHVGRGAPLRIGLAREGTEIEI